MSSKPKRNAQQAFEPGEGPGSEHGTKRQKKHKSKKHRRDSSGNDDAAAQLLREEQQSSSQALSQPEAPGQDTIEGAVNANDSKRKRKAKRKSLEESTSTPNSKPHVSDEAARSSMSGSPKSVRKEGPKHPAADDARGGSTEGKLSKNKKRKLEKRLKRLEEDPKSLQEADQAEDKDVPRLSKREKSRLKAKLKRQEAGEQSAVSLESRIESPDGVAPEDIREVSDVEDETELAINQEGNAEQEQSLPLEDRIEAPPTRKSKKKPKNKTLTADEGWSLAKPVAGTFIDQDPIVTQDDRYLILPTMNEVRIYSSSTSLLVRSLRVHGMIASCAISKTSPSRLIVGRSDGKISLWDWTLGLKIQDWRSPRGLRSLTSMSAKGPDGAELVLALHSGGTEDRQLAVYALSQEREASLLQVLLTRKLLNADVQLFEEAGIIVASAYSRLVIGQSTGLREPVYSHSAVTWREVPVPSSIISVDAHVYEVGSKASRNRLDVAVGLRSGTITIYEDLLYNLIAKEKKKLEDDIAFRSLNWHRTAVNTIKWSRDGNYIISGGNETVLVIWQLDTNRQQFLPHLTTEIRRLSVSSRGSSYALLLGDNSVMVLSTADLNPTANVALLGAPLVGGVAGAMHPTKQGHLLAAIPSSTAPVKADQATSLQTYDVRSDMQIAKQAMTRNLATALNITPEGQPTMEPNVEHLQVSYDGVWLATVENWTPPSADLDAVHLQGDGARKQTTETTLKFWLASEADNEWDLTNRVDGPHGTASILALASCPTRAEFATVSSDGIVHTWVPRARRRDGVLVRGSRGQTLHNWHVSRKISLNPTNVAKAGALAYAEDGSLLSASLSTSGQSAQWTSLIPLTATNADTTNLHHVPALHPRNSSFVSAAFVGPNLITLSSSSLSVYDTINAHHLHTITVGGDLDLSIPGTQAEFRARHHLAANPLDGTFALALNPGQDYLPSRVLVLSLQEQSIRSAGASQDEESPKKSPVVFEAMLNAHVTSLLPRGGAPGYVVIDSEAAVREIRGPGAAGSGRVPAGAAVEREVLRGLDALFGAAGPSMANESSRSAAAAIEEASASQETTGAPKTLEDVLGWQSSLAVPSVKDVFERVVGLFRKPAASEGSARDVDAV